VKKRQKAIILLLAIIVGIPFILWLSWLLTTPRPVSLFIMDKTSYTENKIKNRAINWVLKHYRFVKPNGRNYSPEMDYFGFFPGEEESYTIRDLGGLSPSEIQSMAVRHHIAYYADSYGVFTNMWPEDRPEVSPAQKIYGGLEWHDLLFLEYMIELKRLVVAEFIFLAPPTQPAQRERAEELLGVEWQGWTGRFFHTLDLTRGDNLIPGWLPALYEKNYGKPWNFKNSGIILVSSEDVLLVLEQGNQLTEKSQPLIRTEKKFRKIFGMSDKIGYPGWFDITFPTSSTAEVISWYELNLTEDGKNLLTENGLPEKFPAVISTSGSKRVIYFAGDFGHTPITRRFVTFKGAKFFELFLADLNDPTDRSAFFLAYYLPVMRKILTDFQNDFLTETDQEY